MHAQNYHLAYICMSISKYVRRYTCRRNTCTVHNFIIVKHNNKNSLNNTHASVKSKNIASL